MSDPLDSDHGALLDRASHGDPAAREQLLALHRERLRRMVALRMDPRLSARLDASDVVQDALAEAHRQLPEYLQERPLPFYPWLRQIAWNRLIDLHRRHVLAQRRSVNREEAPAFGLPDESALALADCLLGSSTSPSARVRREEERDQVQQALLRLNERDREVLVLRYLEKLSTSEIASVLGIREGAVKVRHLRALERMRNLMDVGDAEDNP